MMSPWAIRVSEPAQTARGVGLHQRLRWRRTTDSGPNRKRESFFGPTDASSRDSSSSSVRRAQPGEGRSSGAGGERRSLLSPNAASPARYHVPDHDPMGRARPSRDEPGVTLSEAEGEGASCPTHLEPSFRDGENRRGRSPSVVTDGTPPSTDRQTPTAQKPNVSVGETAAAVRTHWGSAQAGSVCSRSGGIDLSSRTLYRQHRLRPRTPCAPEHANKKACSERADAPGRAAGRGPAAIQLAARSHTLSNFQPAAEAHDG